MNRSLIALSLFFILLIQTFSLYCQVRTDYKMVVDGAMREFIVVKPSGLAPAGGYPVVFMLHGTSGDGERFFLISGWKEKGEQEKFISVFPSSLRYCVIGDAGTPVNLTKWNNGDLQSAKCPNVNQDFKDDVKFIRKMVDTIQKLYMVHPKKIFASGFSNGCVMANKLAMDASDIFAAVASSGALLHPLDSTKPARQIPIWLTIGTLDENVVTGFSIPSLPFTADSLQRYAPLFINRFLGAEELKNAYTEDKRNLILTLIYNKPIDPSKSHSYLFSVMKGLDHMYPNGSNYPLSAPDLFWPFFKESIGTISSLQGAPSEEISLDLYPNPSNAFINIIVPEKWNSLKTKIQLFKSSGQILHTGYLNSENIPRFEKAKLGTGLFLIKLQNGAKTAHGKWIFY